MEGDILRALSSGWRQEDPGLLQRALERGLCSDELPAATAPRRSSARTGRSGTRRGPRNATGTATGSGPGGATAARSAAARDRGAAGEDGRQDQQPVAEHQQQGGQHGTLS